MRLRLSLLIAASTLCGCTHLALERRTIQQGSTLTDLQYRQVMDNLAMFVGNPDALAWHVKLSGGLIQVADQGNVGFETNLASGISNEVKNIFSPSVGAQRGVLGQWNVEPAVDTDELELLNLAYRNAVRPGDPETKKDIRFAIWEQSLAFDIRPGMWVMLDIVNDAANEYFEEIQRGLQTAGVSPEFRETLDAASNALEESVNKQRLGMNPSDFKGNMISFENSLIMARSMAEQRQRELTSAGKSPQTEALELAVRKLNSLLDRSKSGRLKVHEAIQNLADSFNDAEIRPGDGQAPSVTQGLTPALPSTGDGAGQRFTRYHGDPLKELVFAVGSRKYIISQFSGQELPRACYELQTKCGAALRSIRRLKAT